jgi:hypothetical protein
MTQIKFAANLEKKALKFTNELQKVQQVLVKVQRISKYIMESELK